MQNKLLLIRDGGAWFRPTGGRPSTHILKVEDRRFPVSSTPRPPPCGSPDGSG
ncbi:MAG: hypothetical protein R2755_05025 [Acidimicrobiales bacterium]